jgi:hypothetical protein
MEVLKLIFSVPGATIVICLTVLTLAIIYLRSGDKFRGLVFGEGIDSNATNANRDN